MGVWVAVAVAVAMALPRSPWLVRLLWGVLCTQTFTIGSADQIGAEPVAGVALGESATLKTATALLQEATARSHNLGPSTGPSSEATALSHDPGPSTGPSNGSSTGPSTAVQPGSEERSTRELTLEGIKAAVFGESPWNIEHGKVYFEVSSCPNDVCRTG